jgi:arylsulfatase A-like enzyme
MKNAQQFTVFLLTAIALTVASTSFASAAERPNILIIFTDDQGFADLACFGSKKNKTPRMDQLAREGTRFTNFYAQTVCGPSRSALLTGRYPSRSKGWSMPAGEITWAELIREVGYQTACIGKWDVSNRKPIIDRMPNAQGFDYYFGTLGANDGGRVSFHENNKAAGNSRDMGGLTRLYTDKAIEFLDTGREKDKPFALYVAHTMMHTIIDASSKFKGKSDGSLYGDVVEEFDYETGRLLDALDRLGLRDNTLVIYTTDNGPWNQPAYYLRKKGHPKGSVFWGDAGPLRNGKGSCYEGGLRVPCIVRWPGKVTAGADSKAIFSTLDFLPTFANLAGFNVPDDRVIDGVDQTDLLTGKRPEGGRETFLYQTQGVTNGIRKGKWKFLKADLKTHGFAVEKNRKNEIELYDLEADIGETKNLAKEHPKVVADLQQLMAELIKAKADGS